MIPPACRNNIPNPAINNIKIEPVAIIRQTRAVIFNGFLDSFETPLLILIIPSPKIPITAVPIVKTVVGNGNKKLTTNKTQYAITNTDNGVGKATKRCPAIHVVNRSFI